MNPFTLIAAQPTGPRAVAGAFGRTSGHAAASAQARRPWLGSVFAVFNVARVFAYMPTLWAIASTADSSQHSLITWFVWFGANLSMAGWLHEREGRVNRAVLVNLGNAVMCLLGLGLICWYRF